MKQLENKLKQLIDNHNRPFKHLREKYDADLIALVKTHLKEEFISVDINQVTINKNNKLGKHKHLKQQPVSYGYVFGNFTDGELVAEDETIALRNKWFQFDGTKEHYVKEFKGDRYSLIAYKRK
jgi:hypothetical protein